MKLLLAVILIGLPLFIASAADDKRSAAEKSEAKQAASMIPNKIAGEYAGGELVELRVRDRKAYLIKPVGAVDAQRRWCWEFPFWLGINNGRGAMLHRHYVEKLLAAGFHVAGVDVGPSCASPSAAKVCQEFYDQLVRDHGLNKRTFMNATHKLSARTMKTLCLLLAAQVSLAALAADDPPGIPLWPDKPPQFLANAPAEFVERHGVIRGVTLPSLVVFPAPVEKRSGMALIICAGGGYGALDWKTHVVYAAAIFNPMGVTVIGLKYRLRPPHKLDNARIQALTLLDAKRAVRTVRHRAAEWGINPRKIGVAGYSAGANLAMNLAANFDTGEADATDPVERESSRPDFAVGCATWHWRQKESPFVFRKDSPPVFLVHATNDGVPNKDGNIGGAPIELPRAIEADLKKLGVPVRMEVFDEGAHGVGNLIPQRVKNGFPPAKWPELLLRWLGGLPLRNP